MSLTWGNALELSRAKLCSNCEAVSDARGETCPACGAFANWLPLARLLLDRAEKPKEQVEAKGVAA